jgi:hypothetical protein
LYYRICSPHATSTTSSSKSPSLQVSMLYTPPTFDHARKVIKCASTSCKPGSTDPRNIVAVSSSRAHGRAFLSSSYIFRCMVFDCRNGPYSSTWVLNLTINATALETLTKDSSPLICVMALHILSVIHVQTIASLVVLTIKKCAANTSPFVRKAAARSIPKCYRCVSCCGYILKGRLITSL